jgi:serine/threonine-protein kinase HipA
MGMLFAASSRGKEIFSFEYDKAWLESGHAQNLDPRLGLYHGKQYASEGQGNFGIFLDSSPDRWGRLLMRRREAQRAREEVRPEKPLQASDYLLGVYDAHRMGALRFRLDPNGPFLDDNKAMASPSWARLRDLEYASLELERDDAEKARDYSKWLRMLIAPGSSLGGSRPKASVIDEKGGLWIAKFPSRHDDVDTGAWEDVAHQLARKAKVNVAVSQSRAFTHKHRTFLTKRFDRTDRAERIHFASALTLLQRRDGDDASCGASYLEIAEFLMREGARPERDLEQLWRRIVFFICISNADDHLRNHGFLLERSGWILAPAYDINPVRDAGGLTLNISETDNALSLELAKEVGPLFRIKKDRANEIITEVASAVNEWCSVASSLHISIHEQDRMKRAFRVVEKVEK